MITLYTIGFTKKSAEQFFGLLRDNGVKQLVDVRISNSSQLAGFAKGIEQQKLLYSNAYAKWTPEEDAELLKLLGRGLSIKELTKIFERNEGAIRSRIKKLTIDPQEDKNGFDSDEETLAHLIELKNEIERQIEALRKKINLKHSIQ